MPRQKNSTLMLTWGFELELFHNNHTRRNRIIHARSILENIVKFPPPERPYLPRYNKEWGIGIDCGIELRSRINTVEKTEKKITHIDSSMKEEIRLVLKAMRDNGYRPNGGTGLHIHVSSDRPITLKEIPRRAVWKSRRPYCDSHDGSRKYKMVHHITNNHFEVRIFNSTTCLRSIVMNVLAVLNNTVLSNKQIPQDKWKSTRSHVRFITKPLQSA